MPDWPHAPVHRLSQKGAYMVTAGTYRKIKFFDSDNKLKFMRDLLWEVCEEYDWRLQAWAVLSNHYHFVAQSSEAPERLRKLISKLHTLSARELNRIDKKPGRKIWHQYWDSHINIPGSYYARLQYVHQNPVRHGLVEVADQYDWCSAKWFKANAEKSLMKTVESFKIDKVKVVDDF